MEPHAPDLGSLLETQEAVGDFVLKELSSTRKQTAQTAF
jgi:hypothetical protein